MSESKIYPSAVDAWIAIIILAAPIVTIGFGVYLLQADQSSGWITIGSGIFIGILIVLLGIPCRYTITADSIEIRCGVIRDTISISSIKSLALSSNPLSAPALSLKRVKIETHNGFNLISPKNREEFIRDVEALMDAEA